VARTLNSRTQMGHLITRPVLVLASVIATGCATLPPRPASPAEIASAREFLATTLLFDGHNDLPWAIRQNPVAPGDVPAYDLRRPTPGHTDIPRLRAGGVGAQFWSVYVPSDDPTPGMTQEGQIGIARRMFERYPDVFRETLTPGEAMTAFESGYIASGMEGGHVIDNSLERLRTFYDMGVRYLTLTHSANTDWADSATDKPEHGGLTDFGREVVREMNRLGMIIDLSHTSTATMHDVLDVTRAPVIFSHSSARALVDVPRNVPDDVLRRVRDNGGVVMVTFVPGFVSQAVADWEAMPRPRPEGMTPPRATIHDVVQHIEHIRKVAGIDHVGIGGDFDGISSVPEGLEDVSTYPALFALLRRRGWSDADLRKLAGENVMRVWREVESLRSSVARLQSP
jgi:membrane dipeptidase